MDPIRLSALGREVYVGNLYNYFTDNIIPSFINVRDQNVHKLSAPKVERFYFFQQPDEFKCHLLGIHSHLKQSIARRFLDYHQLWFAGNLEMNSTEENADKCSTAQVDVIFRIVKRIESLSQQHFEHSQMHHYQLNTEGQATHLVEEVVYGIEIICSMQRVVDLTCESQAIVEEEIYLAAKTYFDQMMDTNSSNAIQIPIELEKITCTIFTSLEAGNVKKEPFHEFCAWLKSQIYVRLEDRPIEIVLRCIPAQIEARLVWEKMNDIGYQKEINAALWKWIKTESNSISKHTSIHRIPPLEKLMCQFIDLLAPIWKSIEMFYTTEQVLDNMKMISDLLIDMKEWLIHRRKEIQITCSLLTDINLSMFDFKEIENRQSPNKRARVFILKMDYIQDLLMERMKNFIGRQETSERPSFDIVTKGKRHLEHLGSLLKTFSLLGATTRETDDYLIGLVPFSSSLRCGEITPIPKYTVPAMPPKGSQNSPNDSFKNQQNPAPVCQLNGMLFPPVKASLGPILYNQRQQLTQAIKHVVHSPRSYHPPLAESSCNSKKHDVGRLEMSSTTEPKMDQQSNSFTSSSSHGLYSVQNRADKQTIVPEVIETVESSSNATEGLLPMELGKKDSIQELRTDSGRDNKVEDSCKRKNLQTKRPEVSVAARIGEFNAKSNEKLVKDENDQSVEVTETTKVNMLVPKVSLPYDTQSNQQLTGVKRQESCRSVETSLSSTPSTQKIAEIFANQSKYADLIKEGQPNIYQLNAKEIMVNEDFRWFEIARPDGVSPSPGLCDHKIIILMGATGCGKSTLINGMVNFILGVQWNDPFRFKCVREDGNVKNQAHSQTSTVTAYTLRHQAGMTIPHSITIIDTPGYGDTRGIKRDKEITSNIHRFLTQQETQIDEIHAACFVAASGDSRLTPTQRYIIDSVLSIFGKDMKDNLRLLVTFADNAVPPVVEACGAAHFPATSASGISYSKFNSSVLYSANGKQGEGDFNFDKLFWDMGQENFHKFFDMLVQMEGRNLTATREVIQRRQQLEQSLKDIESELEVCLVNIEEIDKFRLQLREYGHNMDANKNFIVEKTEMRPMEVYCDKGLVAFNCKTCQKTCEKPSVCKNFKKRTCCNVSCTCPKSAHEIQPFTWIWRPAKVKITLNDMKAQFESNSNRKLSTEDLMSNCSDELNIAKAKVLSLLDQVGANATSLDSTALRSNALNPAEYLSLMRSRVMEGQASGYLTRLQTLTELQQSLTASTKKGQSSISQVTSQPVKNANVSCGRGRGILLQTSTAGTAGMSESKPDYSERKGRDKTPSRSSQTSHSSSSKVQSTASTALGSVNRNHIQNNISGFNPNGNQSMASGQAEGRSRGRGRSNSRDTAASVIHGDGNQRKHPPGEPEDYYRPYAKTSKKPCFAKEENRQNPDGSAASITDPSSLIHGKSDVGNESKSKLAEDKKTYSSDDDADQCDENKKSEKKPEGFVRACRNILSKLGLGE